VNLGKGGKLRLFNLSDEYQYLNNDCEGCMSRGFRKCIWACRQGFGYQPTAGKLLRASVRRSSP